jgi:dihydrodipicolinate synthase/N-acetylneuraminate lyase
MKRIDEKRQALIHELFPGGIPRLWCPLLTHFSAPDTIDFDRMSAHFRHIATWVKGLLVPGTTGEGWELDDNESLDVTRFALRMAREHGTKLLLGALRTDTEAVKKMISSMLPLIDIKGPLKKNETIACLRAAGVCGFAVCPPKGKSLTQAEIRSGLSAILDMGLPIALYQLPFMTDNEAAPETFAELAHKYSNLIFFKDSSGRDLIALSAVDKGGVFLVRGAEGDYIRWLKDADGPYDGFLLSVANSFSPELSVLIEFLETGDRIRAGEISERITKTLFKTISLVKTLPYGNPFTNANKAIDHFFAYGPSARKKEGPILKTGTRLPPDVLAATGDILQTYSFMPEKGYLD